MPAAGNNWSLHRVDVAPLVFCFTVLAAVSSVSPPEMKNPARLPSPITSEPTGYLPPLPAHHEIDLAAAAGRADEVLGPFRQRQVGTVTLDQVGNVGLRLVPTWLAPNDLGADARRGARGARDVQLRERVLDFEQNSRKRRSRRERGLCHPLTTKCTSRRGLGRPFPRCHLSIKLLDHARQLGARAPLIFRAKIG